MTFSEIKELLDSGFTRDDIMTLAGSVSPDPVPADLGPEPEPDPSPAEDPVPDPSPAEDPVPDPAPAPAPAQASAPDPITKQLNDNISKLIKTIQASNLINNTADKLPDLNKEVDSIMESLIRPIKGGNDK